jgi:hypothetical protein
MKLKVSHNLDEVQLEEALEKALKGLRKNAENPDAPLSNPLSEKLRTEAFGLFDKVIGNMMKEIKEVIERE